jgi:dolichol-phosphate mannosyltransferase
MRSPDTLYSIVLPVHNEAGNVREIHARLVKVLGELGGRYEIVFVDDGSTDASLEEIEGLAAADPHVKYVSFSRNFGHEAASTAGLDRAAGDAVILMDADMQDPPETIPALVAKWREGYAIVSARRESRAGESLFKQLTASFFYRILNLLSEHHVPVDTGDFRLMDACVVRSLRRCPERVRFMRGLVSWQGFRHTTVPYHRPSRGAGETKYHAMRLARLAVDALTGFSLTPVRIASVLGLATVAATGLAALGLVVAWAVAGGAMPAAALLTTALFFLGGVQMLLIGILGEYVGRVYREVQQRPLYVVRKERGWDGDTP